MTWRTVVENDIFRFKQDDRNWLRVEEKLKGVVVVAKHEDKYVFIEILRETVGYKTLELVRGCVENSEDFIEGAKREVLEETGFELTEAKDLGRIRTNTGTVEDNIRVVSGTIKSLETENPQEDEGITGVVLLTKEQVIEKVKNKEIECSMTLAGLHKEFLD